MSARGVRRDFGTDIRDGNKGSHRAMNIAFLPVLFVRSFLIAALSSKWQ
jgi:hypothetical protein